MTELTLQQIKELNEAALAIGASLILKARTVLHDHNFQENYDAYIDEIESVCCVDEATKQAKVAVRMYKFDFG